MISFCMIVKNEERLLRTCINSIKEIADEIIVVDTGSADLTPEIAESMGARVVHAKWNNDFSKARNIYLEHAKGEWILTLDADEQFAKEHIEKVKQLTSMGFDAFTFPIWNFTNDEFDHRFVRMPLGKFKGYIETKMVRMFKNKKEYYYTEEVHEKIDESLEKAKASVAVIDIPIFHFEELKNAEEIKQKQINYMEYSKNMLEKNPNNVKALCDVALVCIRYLNNDEQAKKYLKKAMQADKKYIRSYILLGECYFNEQDYDKAIEVYKKGLCIEPEDQTLKRNIEVCVKKKK